MCFTSKSTSAGVRFLCAPPLAVQNPITESHMIAFSTLRRLGGLAAIAVVAAACDDAGPNTNVSVRMASPAQAGLSAAADGGLDIAGTNGTLHISTLKLIVDEFELDKLSNDCNDDVPGVDCEKFERKLFAVDVPLGSGAVTIDREQIAAGTYTELEFEVKDLEDESGDEDAARLAALLAELRAQHPDWPARASMLIEGTFTPVGGAPQGFRAYFEAEIEIEYALSPVLVVDETSTSGVTIDLRPDLWFRNLDGTVRDLSLLDYPTTATTVEFEVEFEDGIRIEFDD